MSGPAQVMSRVHEILTEHFDHVEAQADRFSIRKGSARAFVEIDSLGEPDAAHELTFVRITVPLLQQVSDSAELHRRIAFSADNHRFGTLALRSVDQHGTCIFFCHTLLGDYLDDDELGFALSEMLTVADDLDDELQAAFGGKRYHED